MDQVFDCAVIGAGPGGYVAAIRAAQLGMRVALCEEREVGGTCLNRGCIPTKTLLHSANLYREAREGADIGVLCGDVRLDLDAVYRRKDVVVAQLREGIEALVKQNRIALLPGRASITAPGAVRVGETEIKAKNILIATGSEPARPPVPGIEHAVTSDELLAAPFGGGGLVIIGGGVIGVEFASFYAAIGVPVTVIEALERILPLFDREIAQNLSMILKKRGVRIVTGARVEEIVPGTEGLSCRYSARGGEETVSCAHVLCAVGRRAHTEGLFANGFSIPLERGCVPVDEHFRTSVPGIWAIGDVTGKVQLAHAASAQGIAAVEDMAGKPRSVNLGVVPSCVYTMPEIAGVGLTADACKERGIAVKTGKFLLTASGKALIERSDRSFIKLVFDAETGKTLGAQLMCPRATDLVGELADAVACGLTREQLAAVIRPHPTFCEAVTEAAEAAEGKSIHGAPARK